jgi:hypothetical protein
MRRAEDRFDRVGRWVGDRERAGSGAVFSAKIDWAVAVVEIRP